MHNVIFCKSGAVLQDYTLYPSTQTPAFNSLPGGGLNVGVVFKATQAGNVIAVRWYKQAVATGTHIGTLWDSNNSTKLGEVTFTGETSSGWQEQAFSSQIPILANTNYTMSVYTPEGSYSYDTNFSNPSGVLRLPTYDQGNFVFSSGVAYPSTTFSGAYYYVDLRFRG